MKRNFYFTAVLILLLIQLRPTTSFGTHIMGGNLSYTFTGYNAGTNKYTFDITLKVYRYCQGTPAPSPLPINLPLGVYDQDTANPTADKIRNSFFSMPLVESSFITPPNANDSCTFLPSVCVEEGIYIISISLDPTPGGYHLIVDRCCRNGNIGNLFNPGDAGQAYYAFVPPTTVANSSPTFGLAPVPFICANDTVSYDNSAFDPDGDSLVYSFETPFNGVSNSNNPQPNPPQLTYPFPILPVTYAAGFSVGSPFGAAGFASIDANTGLTLYLSQNIAFYVVAVEVKEYRNSVLIGITRRDLQLIFITCPANPAPNIAAITQPHLQDTIIEGQTICFPITYTDPNGDSLFLSFTGNIFNGAIVNPPATLSTSSGLGTVTSQFCWTTSCDQGQSTPYQFNIAVSDNGCPAKTTNNAYSILVIPFTTPAITGTDTICGNAITGLVYTAPGGIAGSTYNWSITNGTQVSGGNTNTITVNWNGTGNGVVSVTALSADSCVGNTQTKNVVIKAIPAAVAGTDKVFCSGGSAALGTGNTPGYTYSWSPVAGISNTTASNPNVTLTNTGATPVTTNYIVTVNNSGCTNTDTVAVTVNPAAIAIAGTDQSLCNGTAFTLGTSTTPGYTYAWSPATGLSSTTISNPLLTYNNTSPDPDTLTYTVTVTNAYNCTAVDNIQIIVRPVPVSEAGINQSFCSGQTVSLGTANTSGYTYSWSPVTGLTNTTISNPNLTLTNTGSTPVTTPYVVTTSIFGCSVNDTAFITVNPAAVANAGPNQVICNGPLINLGTTSTAGYSYSWTPATGLSNTTISNPVLTYNNTGNDPDTMVFTVFVTNAYGCTATDNVQIIVSPVPTANAGNNVIFCSGQSASLGTGSTSGYSYSWSPATGLSGSSVSNPTVTLTNTGTTNVSFNYIVTASWFNCTDNDTVVVTVKPLPVSNAGANLVLCAGDTITIGTAVTAGYTYAWTPSTGLSNTTISDPSVIVSNPGTVADTLYYTVTTTLNGCTTSDSIQIITNPLPLVQGSANPTAVCSGSPATLTGTGAVTYSWALLTAPGSVIGAGATITVSPLVTTSYIVTGTSGVNCDNTDTITVTVNPLPNVQALTPNDTICEGDSITITGNGANSYSWALLSSPGSPISISNSIVVGPSATTSYIVTGTDGNGCVNRDTIQIFVNGAPLANQINGNISVCPGVTGVSYWVTPPTAGSNYSWSVSGGSLTGGQGTDSVFVDWDSTGTGIISVIEITALGCPSDTILLPVNINVILTPAAPTGITTICHNQALGMIYSCTSTPQSAYTWYITGGTITGGGSTNTVTVDWTLTGPGTGALWYEELSVTTDTVCFGISDTLYVTINPSPATSAITGDPDICVFDSTGVFSVTNTSGSNYSWGVSPGTVISGAGSNSVTATWGTSGLFTVFVVETNQYGCPGDTVSKPLLVNPLPVADAGSDAAICIGDNTSLSASGGIAYSWSPATGLNNTTIQNPVANPQNTTTYIVLVTDTNGCENTDDVVITVNLLPVADAGPDLPICLNKDTMLTASGGVNYEWTPATGLSNTAISNPVAGPLVTTTYIVTVTDTNSCRNTDTITVTVNSLPVAVASADSVICNGSGMTLTASGGVGYSWSPSTGLDNTASASPFASPTSNTTYTVTVTDGNGCTDTEDVQVNVNAQPVAAFEFTDSVDCSGVTIYFKNNSTNAIDYIWNYGDTKSKDFEPVKFFTFNQPNNTVTLIAINNDCSDTTVVACPINNLGKYLESVPNIFTPNGDGINDCYSIDNVGNFKECAAIQIFNRWGKLMFEADNGNECWDGNNQKNGQKCDDGVYFYILSVKGAQLKGSISLMR